MSCSRTQHTVSSEAVGPGFINTSLCSIQRLFKDFKKTLLQVFKGYKIMKNTDLQIKILLQKCLTEILKKLVLEN